MRIIIECAANAVVGATGNIRVELSRSGLPSLSDERPLRVVEIPPARPSARQLTLPPFETRPVNGPDDTRWNTLNWPDEIDSVASSALTENGKLIIYYSTAFPKYATQRANFERRDVVTAASFTRRYEIWLAVHSLLLHREQRDRIADAQQADQGADPETEERREREERCRVATLSAMFAAREAQSPMPSGDE